jgi:hypothetical protein
MSLCSAGIKKTEIGKTAIGAGHRSILMSEKNWDRVPIDAQSIDAPLIAASRPLSLTRRSPLGKELRSCY